MSPTERRIGLLRAGFAPIPVIGKAPPLDAWQTKTVTNDGEIELWSRDFPYAIKTGFLTQKVPTFDIDIRHPEAAEAVEVLVREHFEERGNILVRIDQAPKRAIPFRTDTPFKKIKASLFAPDGTEQKIEFLGDGQQVVAFGIHPDTHKAYSWQGGEPGQIRREDLPYITAEEAQRLVEDAAKLLCDDFGYKPSTRKEPNGAGSSEDWSYLLANIRTGSELHELDPRTRRQARQGRNGRRRRGQPAACRDGGIDRAS